MTNRCPHCGVKIDSESAKCGFCGAPLNVPNGEPPQFPPIPALYSPGYVLWVSLILTPVFGSWCSRRNAKAMGDRKTERIAGIAIPVFLILEIASAVFVVCGLPNMVDLTDPNAAKHIRALVFLINLIPWIGYFFLIHKPQVDYIKGNDITCSKKSCFLPVLVALVLTIAAAAALVGIMIACG